MERLLIFVELEIQQTSPHGLLAPCSVYAQFTNMNSASIHAHAQEEEEMGGAQGMVKLAY